MKWKIEVTFCNEYESHFDKDEQVERADSEYRFVLAIGRIIEDTGVVPTTNDWISPLAKPDYSLDIGRVVDRTFYPVEKKIVFGIE